MSKEGKFLQQQSCCVGGRIQQGNLVLSTELVTVKSFKADVSSVSLSSDRMEKLWVVCVCLYAKNGATLLVGIW